jgi:hypothetical protein
MTKRDFQKYLRSIHAPYTDERFKNQTKIGNFIVTYSDGFFLVYTPHHSKITSITIHHESDASLAFRKLLLMHMRVHGRGLMLKDRVRKVNDRLKFV